MTIEPSVIKALVGTLRDWGHKITDDEVEELIAEWDRAPKRPPLTRDPYANQLGRWRKDGPDASRKAALDNYPRSGSQRKLVLEALIERGERGYTADELRTEYGLRFNTTAARLHDLEKDGWLEINGERKTSSGSMGRVYVISPEAKAKIAWNQAKESLATIPR